MVILMTKDYSIRDSQLGYKEVTPKPSAEELRRYYAEKYYQEEQSTYAASYSDAERQFFRNKIEQKYRVEGRPIHAFALEKPL